MKINADIFLDHLDKASVGGLINEIVLGKNFSFASANIEQSVVSICSKGIVESLNAEIGVHNLKVLRKAVQYTKENIFCDNKDIEMEVVDNKMVFKNEMNEFKFQLSNPNNIATVVDNPDEVLEKIRASDAIVVTFITIIRNKCLEGIKLFHPDDCLFIVDAGKVMLMIGNEKREHSTSIYLGSAKGDCKMKIAVKPSVLMNILKLLADDIEVTIELRNELPIIFQVPNYTLLLSTFQVPV